jgi:hypothetical protein
MDENDDEEYDEDNDGDGKQLMKRKTWSARLHDIYITCVQGSGLALQLTINHRGVFLFGAAAIGIFFYGDYASV